MSEWKEVRLGDVCEKITKGTTPTSIGCKFTKEGINYIKSESLLSCRKIDASKFTYISDETHARLARSQIKVNDILFSMAGMFLGKTGIVTHDIVPANTNQAVALIRVKANLVHYEYIYYYLNQNELVLSINSMSAQSAQPNINLTQIGQIPVMLPPLEIQKKIASVLSALDEKIELNNKINKDLEDMAQAIFNSWFVDFEPFGGVIPDEWREETLESLCSVITKGTTPTTLGKKFVDKGINFFKVESILDSHRIDVSKISHIDEETNTLLKRSEICAEDIVFTIAGTLGRFAIVDKTLLPANTNQAVAIIRADKEKIQPIYLYSFFIGDWHNEFYKKRVQQAVQANLSLTTIKLLKIPVLPKIEMQKYLSLISPLFCTIVANNQENQRLSQLRDTLLPRLMSGEIDVEKVVAS